MPIRGLLRDKAEPFALLPELALLYDFLVIAILVPGRIGNNNIKLLQPLALFELGIEQGIAIGKIGILNIVDIQVHPAKRQVFRNFQF